MATLTEGAVKYSQTPKAILWTKVAQLYLTIFLIAPLELHGEGNYALNVVKEIKITDDFLSLDVKTKKCQNKESVRDCSTRKYLKKLEENCNCVPYKLRNFTKENQVHLIQSIF